MTGRSQNGCKIHNPPFFNRLIVVMFFLGLLFNPFEAQQTIPYVLTMATAIALCFMHARAIPSREAYHVVLFLITALVCTIIAPRTEYFPARLRSYAYLSASVAAGFILYVELRRWPRRLIAKYAALGALSLLMGAGLEITIEAIERLSDAYREWNFRFPYFNDQRDLFYHGMIRPKFFSAEPSHLGLNYSFLMIAWLLTSTRRRRLMMFALASGFGVFVMRTPILLILPVATVLYLVFGRRSGMLGPARREARLTPGPIGIIVIAMIFSAFSWEAIGQRLAGILGGRDASAAVRIWVSFASVPRLLAESPLTGIGVGGTEAYAHDVIATEFSSIGEWLIREKIATGMLEHLVQNSIASYMVAFGLLGGVIGLVILRQLQRHAAPNSGWIFWSMFLLFAMNIGALNGVVLWSTFFLFLAITAHAKRARQWFGGYEFRAIRGCAAS